MEKKKSSWLAWLVAIVLVAGTVGSYVYIKHEEGIRAVKLAKEKKRDEHDAKINVRMMKKQREHLRKPVEWNKPSETLPYPEIAKYRHYSKLNRVWLSFSLAKQRLYVHQGPFTIYTMYAYGNPNYQTMDNRQKTPLGIFKIKKTRGTNYYDAPSARSYAAWISYSNPGDPYGVQSMLQAVPTDKNGKVDKEAVKCLGKSFKHKHVAQTNGAIWLTTSDAEWLEKNIPAKTMLVIQSRSDKGNPYNELKSHYKYLETQKKFNHKNKEKDHQNED